MKDAFKLSALGLIGVSALFAWHDSPAQTAVKSADSDSNELVTIIVTAQKRSEDIQTVPVSITVLDSKTLQQLGATQLSDYAGYIPGLQLQSDGSPGRSIISLRGIGPLGSSATVAAYIDDTPLGSSSLYGAASVNTLDLLPFDFQSFDVLRGPQGTLYGASSLGGLIKYVTNKPDLTKYTVDVGVDTFVIDDADKPGIGGRIKFNLPLVPDLLGMTASFSRENTPGYTGSVVTGVNNQNAFYQQAGRVALLWMPTDDLSVSVSGLNQQINANGSTSVALSTSLQPIYGTLRYNNYMPTPYTNTLNYFSASVNWNLGWADFNSATSYSETKTQTITDATLIYGPLFPLLGLPADGISQFIADLSLYKATQEFRLTSKPSDKFEWLVGTFYTHENSLQDQTLTAQAADGTPFPVVSPLETIALPSTYKEYALFGDATYKFSSLFDITGGARWAHNSQNFSQTTGGALGLGEVPGSPSSEGVWTWSASPRLHLSPDTMIYARVATGYQPGGPNVAATGVPPTVNSDTVTNYEIGIKTLFDDRRVVVDADVFKINWHDIQVGAQTAGGFGYITNGGTAHSQGLEFSTLYTPIQGLRLGLNLAYTEAVLTQDIPSLGGFSGDSLPNIPKWAGSVTADYTMPVWDKWQARFGGGVRYIGDTETQFPSNPQAFPLASYSVVDLNAGVFDDRWNFRFYARNVANKQAYINENPIQNAATGTITQVSGVPLQPRTVGIGIDLKF